MANVIVLTDADRALLQGVLDSIRAQRANPSQRPNVDWVEHQAADVYLCTAPDTGIPSMLFYGPTGLPEPGIAICTPYQPVIIPDVPFLEPLGFTLEVFNAGSFIPAGSWILAVKDKWGVWWAVMVGAGLVPLPEFTGTGTGTHFTGTGTYFTGTGTSTSTGTQPPISTGTGTRGTTGTATATGVVPCHPVVMYEQEVRCESGALNIYVRTVTLWIYQGCLQSSFGPWAFDRVEGCCDCFGTGTFPPTTGTGTSTSTSTSVGTGTSTGSGGVSVGCCPLDSLPSTITGTISLRTAGCVCVPSSISLVWNSVTREWVWSGNVCGLTPCQIVVQCYEGITPNVWRAHSSLDPGIFNANAGASCNPLSVVFDMLGAICGGSFRLSITP
jgi:hypothetical protein